MKKNFTIFRLKSMESINDMKSCRIVIANLEKRLKTGDILLSGIRQHNEEIGQMVALIHLKLASIKVSNERDNKDLQEAIRLLYKVIRQVRKISYSIEG